LTLADIVHFALLSPPCTFPGFQIIRHSEHRFFCTFFDCRLPSLWVTSALTSSPHFLRYFAGSVLFIAGSRNFGGLQSVYRSFRHTLLFLYNLFS